MRKVRGTLQTDGGPPFSSSARTQTVKLPIPRSIEGVNDVPDAGSTRTLNSFVERLLIHTSYSIEVPTAFHVIAGRSEAVTDAGPVSTGAAGCVPTRRMNISRPTEVFSAAKSADVPSFTKLFARLTSWCAGARNAR